MGIPALGTVEQQHTPANVARLLAERPLSDAERAAATIANPYGSFTPLVGDLFLMSTIGQPLRVYWPTAAGWVWVAEALGVELAARRLGLVSGPVVAQAQAQAPAPVDLGYARPRHTT